MGIITLTDRISVRVSAKNTSQSNDYKKATGGAIGKTLGNEDISDELKTQLGNTTKPVITDEDGNAWISMADIIAAGKAMNAAGAFGGEDHWGDVKMIPVTSLPLSYAQYVGWLYGPYCMQMGSGSQGDIYRYIGAGTDQSGPIDLTGFYIGYVVDNGDVFDIIEVPEGSSGLSMRYGYNKYPIDPNHNYYNELDISSYPISGTSPDSIIVVLNGMPKTYTTYKGHHAYMYGDYNKTGGSLIDWTKTDAELEEDIRDLHETWDVSEHEGSVTANGTYVLAGPIEFNPADPTQGPPGSVG